MKEILLIGNPNTGKTTLFNNLTKSNEHIGNWHGVTVEEKRKKFNAGGEDFELVDLPGIYSLTALSFEEQVAVDYILNGSDKLMINICDLNNLQRNLYLTLGLLELGANILLAINTMGSKKPFNEVDVYKLKEELGVEVFLFNASSKKDIAELKLLIKKMSDKPKKGIMPSYINKLENCQEFKLIKNSLNVKEKDRLNFYTIKILENDQKIIEKCGFNNKKRKLNADFIQKIAKIRYEYISCISEKAIKKIQKRAYGESKIDKIILNRFLSIPIFLGIMALIFYLTFFSVGAFFSSILSDFIQNVIGANLVNFIAGVCDIPWVIGLFENGIVAGLGSILSFLPQVVLLFFFLSILEDSGYLARLAFSFEDIFKKLGLSGKSVYTLLMGFGCSATAALTARNMEDKNSKIKTAMLTPYMSCSAKLPIYAVLGGAFFGASNIFIVFSLYLLGVVVAIILSMILEKTALKSKNQSFILEFPPYRIPSFKRVLNIIGDNLKQFIIRIGSVIFAMNIIVWLLGSFSFSFTYVPDTGGVSMLEGIGKFLAPIFIPLGFGNWGATSALIAGLVAKEVIVSSIAIFNGIDVNAGSMTEQVQSSILNPNSAVYFTPASALSYMVFCLIYMPCIATMSVLNKEIGTKWTVISIIIELVIAYLLSLVVYNLYNFINIFGLGYFAILLIGLIIIGVSVTFIIKHLKSKDKCKVCGYKCKN